MSLNNPQISIVVPVYNVEKYLNKCIDSLLLQSYENIEIILVDDGSTDKSGDICDSYKNCKKIKVVHKQNEGLGYARNSGLEVASGKYVAFVDSDDWVSPSLIDNLYDAITKYKVDFAKNGFRRVTNDGTLIEETKYQNEVFSGDAAAKKLLPRMIGSAPNKHDSLEMCAVATLYKMDIIRTYDMKFPSERKMISEDLVFNIDYLQKANGAVTIDSVDYYYRMNATSLSHSYRPDRMKASESFYLNIRQKLMALGYNMDTVYRLDRMFFIYTRMSISQEKTSISKHNNQTSLNNIHMICENKTLRSAIKEYPIKQLGFKQQVFLKLLIHKNTKLLLYLANRNIL